MKRILVLAMALAFNAGCRATLEMHVSVYRGPTLDTMQEPSFDRVASSTNQIVEASGAAAEEVKSLADSAILETGAIEAATSEGDTKIQELSKSPEYAKAAQAYLDVYRQGFAALKTALSAANAAEKQKQTQAALAKLAQAAAPQAGVLVGKEPVAQYFGTSFASWAGKVAEGKPRAAAVVSALVGASECSAGEAKCASRRAEVEKELSKDPELVTKVAGAFPPDLSTIDMTPKGTSLDRTNAQNVKKALAMIQTSTAAGGGIANALAAVRAAGDKVRLKVATLRGTESREPPRVRLAGELAELERSTQMLASAVQQLQPTWNDARSFVLDARADLAGKGLAVEAAAPATDLAHALKKFQEKAVKISAGLLTLASQDATQALAAQPFRTTDPNLKTLADPENDKYWEGKSLDRLKVRADGTSQFVVVQETPVNFKLKRLHADPSKSAELAMSVAEVGFNVLSAVALNGAELPGSASTGNDGTAASAAAGGDEAAVQQRSAAVNTCRSGARDLVSKLRAELSILKAATPTPGAAAGKKARQDPDQVARIQGIVHGQLAVLKACDAELERANDPKAGQAESAAQESASAENNPKND